MRTAISFAFVFSIFLAVNLHAQQVCDAALVKSTYNNFNSDDLDWRLATVVTEKDYNEIKQGAGASAVIYGVPVGVDYNDFQKRVHEKRSSNQESLTRNQLRNIQWTGLDPNSRTTYADCLSAQVFASRGLHMAVKAATKTDISVVVSWNPQGADAAQIALQWAWHGSRLELPAHLQQGSTTVVVPRPDRQRTLAVNSQGFTDSVVLDPLPQRPPPPPPQVCVRELPRQSMSDPFNVIAKDLDECSGFTPEMWVVIRASGSFQLEDPSVRANYKMFVNYFDQNGNAIPANSVRVDYIDVAAGVEESVEVRTRALANGTVRAQFYMECYIAGSNAPARCQAVPGHQPKVTIRSPF